MKQEEVFLELLMMGVICVEKSGCPFIESRNESGPYVHEYDDSVELTGRFTARQLRAISEWMEMHA